MPITMHDTTTLLGVRQKLKKPTTALLDRYFRRQVNFDTKKVALDVVSERRVVAPFVSPKVEGQILKRDGFKTTMVEPGYVKPKIEFDPDEAVERQAGEAIGGAFTPEQRHNVNVVSGLEFLYGSIWRRLEMMAADLLLDGKLVIVGAKYPEQELDFERHSDLKPSALTGGNRWDQSGSKPLAQFSAASRGMVKHAGFGIVDAIMGWKAFDAFQDNAQVAGKLQSVVPQGTAFAPAVEASEGLQLQGRFNNVNIFTYTGYYDDPDTGTTTEIFPATHVAFTSPLLDGIRLFGAIKDGKAGYRSIDMFPKMIEEDDPADVYLMVQSAPVLAFEEVNGAYVIQVVD